MTADTVVRIDIDKTVSDIIKDTVQEGGEDPFYVIDLGDIAFKYNLWKDLLPRVHSYYAVKCNDCPMVLELLAALGAGFDCASKREIDAVLKSGASSSSIIYANPCKASSFITYAASMGIDVMTFDNELELHKIKKLFPQARMVLRIRVDDSKSICQLGMKFGCYEQHIPSLLRVAKDLDLKCNWSEFSCRQWLSRHVCLCSGFRNLC
jgi:ornithine decarboxylase